MINNGFYKVPFDGFMSFEHKHRIASLYIREEDDIYSIKYGDFDVDALSNDPKDDWRYWRSMRVHVGKGIKHHEFKIDE